MSIFDKKKPPFGEHGKWFRAASDQELIIFMLGFAAATSYDYQLVSSMIVLPSKPESLPIGVVGRLFEATASELDFSKAGWIEWGAHLKAFYMDSKNDLVPPQQALHALRDEVAGGPL
jgi:hypothetical protein